MSSSCAHVRDEVVPELRHEPWNVTRAGTVGLATQISVFTDYQVDSTVEFVGANFGEPYQLSGEMIGRFGAGQRVEWYPVDDLSLFIGGEYRVFKPDLASDFITIGEASQTEFFLGSRWYLPLRFLESQRLRAFLHAKLAYIPVVEFEMTTRIPFPNSPDAILLSPYSGSEYWSFGAGGGLSYQLSYHWLMNMGFFYEWPITYSTGRSGSELVQGTGDPFVDDLLSAIEYDVEIKPYGWIGLVELTYSF
jgi:hypothetical protein